MASEFERMVSAEEEIEAARARHPQHADRLYHSFSLLQPITGLDRMRTEFVYRSHCRELLDRVNRELHFAATIGPVRRTGVPLDQCWRVSGHKIG
jgi:hypothetical protein